MGFPRRVVFYAQFCFSGAFSPHADRAEQHAAHHHEAAQQGEGPWDLPEDGETHQRSEDRLQRLHGRDEGSWQELQRPGQDAVAQQGAKEGHPKGGETVDRPIAREGRTPEEQEGQQAQESCAVDQEGVDRGADRPAAEAALQGIARGRHRPQQGEAIPQKDVAAAAGVRKGDDAAPCEGQSDAQPAQRQDPLPQDHKAQERNVEDLRIHQHRGGRNACEINRGEVSGEMDRQARTAAGTQQQLPPRQGLQLFLVLRQQQRQEQQGRETHAVQGQHRGGGRGPADEDGGEGQSRNAQDGDELLHGRFLSRVGIEGGHGASWRFPLANSGRFPPSMAAYHDCTSAASDDSCTLLAENLNGAKKSCNRNRLQDPSW